MEIITDKNKLTITCDPVASENEAIEIAGLLRKALSSSPESGIGLAANQIGINKQVCLLRLPETDRQSFRYEVEIVLANPKIIKLSEPVKFSKEGCLSFPGSVLETLRYNRCTVSDLLQPEGRDFFGLRAVCAQHEIDHLNGKTMYDSRLADVKLNGACPCGSGSSFKLCCKKTLKDF